MLSPSKLRASSLSAFALAASLEAAPARAAPGAVRVDVTDGRGCVDAARFARALFDRIRRPRGGVDADDTVVSVSVDPTPTGYIGRLAIIEPGGPARERRVTARSCGELELSLVVVAAIALGGEEPSDAAEPPSPGPLEDPKAPEPPAPAPPAQVERAATTVLGAHASLTELGGTLAPGADAFVGREPARSGFALGGRLALGVAQATTRTPRAALQLTPITLRAELSFANLAAGPLRMALAGALEPGLVVADTGGQARGGPIVRPWVRAGLATQAHLPVSRALGIEVDGSMLFPLVRDSLVIEGAGLDVRAPVLGLGVRLGLRLKVE
jgi:hypothetical protein